MSNTENTPGSAEGSPAGRSRWRRVRAECLEPRTLRLKLLYLTLFAGVVVVWVQLGPYQKSLGLTERDTGVMSIVGSSMIIAGPMVTGVWADALGDFRRLVAATALLNGVVAFGFTLVPPASSIGNVSLKTDNISTNLCSETLNSSSDNLSELRHNTDLDQSLNLHKSNLSQDFNLDELSGVKQELTNYTDLTSVFLQPRNDESDIVVVLENFTSYYISHNASSLRYNLPDAEVDSVNSLSYDVENGFGDRTVSADAEELGRSVATLEEPSARAEDESTRCVTRPQTPNDAQIVGEKAVTYWAYLTLHASFMLLNSATISMFESGVLAAVAEHNINYGHQRCFASIAATISAPIGGLLVDLTGSRDDKSNYRTVLYTSCSLMVVSSALLLGMDMSFKKPAVARLKNIPAVFANVRLLALFFVTFLAGLLMGYGETFVYRYLHGLGASASLLGTTVTVGGCIEGVLMVFLSCILAFAGVYVCLVAGFFCFAFKFLGLYVLQNPAFALLLEALDSVSTGLFMAVASLHLTALVPCEALASMRGLLGTTYMGLGKMAGAAVGTAVVGAYGVRLSWAIMSAAAFALAILLILGALLFTFLNKSNLFKKKSNESLQTVCPH